MVPYIRWLDRGWRFDFPVRHFPNLVERLRGTPARLEDRLAALPRDELVLRVNGMWSLQEHAGHLLDLTALDAARIDDFTAERERLTAADMTNRRTNDARHNDRPIDRILADFRRERSAIVRQLDAADESFAGRTALHPRLGVVIRVVDWVYFVAEHDDHHLAAIASVLHGRHGRIPEIA
jgi:hypothetical protein